MDIKGYILWGGGILIVLVLLHGLYWAWRSRRGGADDVVNQHVAPQQTDLQLDNTPPMLMEAQGDGQERPWLDETASNADAHIGHADGAPQAAQFDAPQRDGTSFDDNARRVVIPGKRTEPTVPIASRPMESAAESAKRADEAEDGMNDVVVIWVLARPGTALGGRGLIEAFTANNLEYGGNVFRKLDPNTGAERYQVVNGVEPGTFDLSNIDALSTSHIVLLLRFNPYNDPAEAFEDMLAVAQDVASSLNGELKDEHMSDMSIQTIEHCRQRIREYKRKSIRT